VKPMPSAAFIDTGDLGLVHRSISCRWEYIGDEISPSCGRDDGIRLHIKGWSSNGYYKFEFCPLCGGDIDLVEVLSFSGPSQRDQEA